MSATVPVDVARAQIVHRGDGSAVVDDPHSPWRLRAWTRRTGTAPRSRLVRLQIDVRDPDRRGDITPARLGRLPVAQILHAIDATAVTGHPNEVFYRMLALPRPVGQRHWDDGHYLRVLEVWRWGQHTGRPGGGLGAIADMWRVARNPTASRWLARARALDAQRHTTTNGED